MTGGSDSRGEHAGDETVSVGDRLADSAGFDSLGVALGADVRRALRAASKDGARFDAPRRPLTIFRQALHASIRDIQTHPRGALFQRFLRDGPYEHTGRIPKPLARRRLSDAQTGEVVTFIYAHMVNCFQGRLAELLACGPCSRLVARLRRQGRLPRKARLWIGDTVQVLRPRGRGTAKGADMHVLVGDPRRNCGPIVVAGVVEVKSYRASVDRTRRQLLRHLRRLRSGLCVAGVPVRPPRLRPRGRRDQGPVRIIVVPAAWKLPRTFHFEPTAAGRRLLVDPGPAPAGEDRIEPIAENQWRITLRWSVETLASAAYDMTFWYMAKVGEVIYARQGVPREWAEMTPSQAGQNAAKMMLYYAIRRTRRRRDRQRAIALYNAYGFGYSLGMNFKNAAGRRQMLWPQDLDELARTGITRSGCRIVK